MNERDKYIRTILEADGEISEMVREFFKENSSPTDDEVHALADELEVDKHRLEEIIYKMLGEFITADEDENEIQ